MSIRDRLGYGFRPDNARQGLETIERAEAAGVPTVWTVMPALARDTLTLFAAAAVRTSSITLGTSIVPAFTRHPVAMATQMMTLEDLAPGRFRLGIGTAHQRTMIPAYGLPFERTLSQLREYLQVLGPLLKEGKVTFEGEFYRANATLPAVTGTPLLISTLRENAFELAGQLTDGAITWLCPIEYVEKVGKPALNRGAREAGRDAPPLVAHVLVSPRTDRAAVVEATRKTLRYYAEAVYYQRMFAAAGFPLGDDLAIPDALIDSLVVSGTPEEIAAGLRARLERGPDELLLNLVPSDDTRADEDAIFRIIGDL
ncbi:MAG: LLM class flavin-dependent oxidoreductase [Thermomicrobiales bacterium]|nr:LLM class flavin-dependent oxidoreductase [Thermomicrobiales bacterium]